MAELLILKLALIDSSPLNVKVGEPRGLPSMGENGPEDPLQVRPKADGRYELVDGHERLYECQKRGLEEVWVLSEKHSDAEVALIQLDKNLDRKILSDYELALKLKQIMDLNPELTQEQLGTRYKKGRTWVTHLLAMIKLEGHVSRDTLAQLTEYQARTILSAPEDDLPVVCAEVERYCEEEKSLPSAADVTEFIKGMRVPGIQYADEGDRGMSPSEGITPEEEFNEQIEKLGIKTPPLDLPSKPEVHTPEAPRYEPSEEEVFGFLNRFKYKKGVDGFLLDSLGELFGLSASQAHDWLERWRNTLSGSTKPTPEEKAIIDEYERTHPKEDDAFRKLSRYYPFEVMDAVLSRVQAESIETLLKYCRRYIEKLHTRAPDELRQATLQEALR